MKSILESFDKFEIPYFLDVKRDILNSPVSRYILSLLDMFIWNFKYENVFEFLKTGLSHIGKNKIETLENYALQYGIEGSKWFERIDDNKTSYIEEIRSTFISDFESEIHEFKNLSTISEITNFIFKYLKKHKVREKVQIKIDQFKKENNYESSSEYSQVWNHIIEVLNRYY